MRERIESPDHASARAARRLMRSARTVAISVSDPDEPDWPYVALAQIATSVDGSPVLLLSELADHTRAVLENGRASLLFDGASGLDEPLTGERLSVTGEVTRDPDPDLRARYLARYPSAAQYVDFGDFGFFRLTPRKAHLIAGFGRIARFAPAAILRPPASFLAGHAQLVADISERFRDALGSGNTETFILGLDDEGVDLRVRTEVFRVEFEAPVRSIEELYAALEAVLGD